jgi:hypothetical protein
MLVNPAGFLYSRDLLHHHPGEQMTTTTSAAPRVDAATGEILDMEPRGLVAVNPPPRATPADLVAFAMQSGDADLDRLERLMRMQIEWDAHEAKKAFNEDFAKAKSTAIKIVHNRTRTEGPLRNQTYADLSAYVTAITGVFSEFGFSHSWKPIQDDKDWIKVECTLKHRMGHSESVALGGPVDTGPARNALQARKSTITQLERVTLAAICGVADQAADDDDGHTGGGEPGAQEQAATSTLEKLLESLRGTTTDEAAATLWSSGKKLLAGFQPQLAEFKAAVVVHRTALGQKA